MTLSTIEQLSPVWHKLKAHYTERLETLRQQNDADMDEMARAKHIGRIAEVKTLLALAAPPPIIEGPR